MSDKQTRTFGFKIETSTFADRPSVVARIMAREEGKAHPANPSSDGESTIFGAPKRLHGMKIDFVIRWWKGEMGETTVVWYDAAHNVEADTAEKMALTLRRVQAAIAKAKAKEPGDILMVVADVIGAEFLAEPAGREATFLSDTTWTWGDVMDARDKFRRVIDETRMAPAKVGA